MYGACKKTSSYSTYNYKQSTLAQRFGFMCATNFNIIILFNNSFAIDAAAAHAAFFTANST